MPSSKQTSLKQPAAHNPKGLSIAFLIFSIIGFLDATYLTAEHYLGGIVPCSLAHGCETVLTSSYATAAGIPVALVGALYYLIVLVLVVVHLDTGRQRPFRVASILVTLGFLTSLWLFCVQAFILHAFCQWCLGSATTTTILFILAAYAWRHRRRQVRRAMGV